MNTSRLLRSAAVTRSLTAAATVLLISASLCSAGEPSARDKGLRKQVLGTWTTKAFGTQELTNYSDGTARLDVTLNRLGSLRYGKSLTLDLVWTIENGVMKHTVKGGSPPEKVARLVRDWGSTLEYQIVEATSSHLLLQKPNEEDQSRWEAKTEVARN
ncbi:MAG: hypothetical protein U0992_05285 [Planctomycetaceae bacterium]